MILVLVLSSSLSLAPKDPFLFQTGSTLFPILYLSYLGLHANKVFLTIGILLLGIGINHSLLSLFNDGFIFRYSWIVVFVCTWTLYLGLIWHCTKFLKTGGRIERQLQVNEHTVKFLKVRLRSLIHDLSNPLMVLLSANKILEKKNQNSQQLGKIAEDANSIRILINQSRAFLLSRQGDLAVQLEPVNLGQCMDQVAKSFQNTSASPDQIIVSHFNDNPDEVFISTHLETLLSGVFANLLTIIGRLNLDPIITLEIETQWNRVEIYWSIKSEHPISSQSSLDIIQSCLETCQVYASLLDIELRSGFSEPSDNGNHWVRLNIPRARY